MPETANPQVCIKLLRDRERKRDVGPTPAVTLRCDLRLIFMSTELMGQYPIPLCNCLFLSSVLFWCHLSFLYYPLSLPSPPYFLFSSLFLFFTSSSDFPPSQYFLFLHSFSSLLLLPSSFSSIILPSFSLSFLLPCGTHVFSSLSRYYAICCQPLVYRNKMTPLRIALMLGGCWVIPMFISFLPIMQGWNNIGIIDLVSTCADPAGLLSDELYVLGILNKQTLSGWVAILRKILIVV